MIHMVFNDHAFQIDLTQLSNYVFKSVMNFSQI